VRVLDTLTQEVGILGGWREGYREREGGIEKEKAYYRGRDGLKFHNPAVSDTLD